MSKFTTPSKKFIALGFFALMASTAVQAQIWTGSAMYNGYGATTQNTPSSYSMRDANGNLTMTNGQIEPAQYSSASGSQYAGVGGTQGAGMASGQATAIGNSLNVTVMGTHNTTIIDSSQINTGNQTATATLNTH